jgi:outer membrane protein assembly factor BamD
MKYILSSILLALVFTGCAKKESAKEYNKPAIYWYNKMIKQISSNQLDDADDTFTSLESEHRKSPLISSAIMIIATAHMDEEEYQMANYYFDEYLKRFSLERDADYIRYLKIKSNFLSFKNEFRNQKLVNDTLEEIEKFIQLHKGSNYIHLVETMRGRLLMAKALFEKEIADLYGRVDKPEAQKIYEEKASKNWTDTDMIEGAKTPWYQAIFE